MGIIIYCPKRNYFGALGYGFRSRNRNDALGHTLQIWVLGPLGYLPTVGAWKFKISSAHTPSTATASDTSNAPQDDIGKDFRLVYEVI